MPSVFLCSPYNSTMFTTCCEAAITDEQTKCPICKQAIEPIGARARWSYAYGHVKRGLGYGNHRPGDRPNFGKVKEDQS